MLNRTTLMSIMTLAIVTTPACHDALAPGDEPVQRSTPPVSASLTATVPKEFETPVSIIRYWADAGFDFDWAFAQAFMRFFANRAESRVELSLRSGHSIVATRTGRTSDGWLLPAHREQWAQTTAGVGASCGHVVDASASFHAWHEALTPFGWLRWSDQHRSASNSALQPSCSSSCADRLVVTPDDSCDDRTGGGGGQGGGDNSDDGGPTDDLDCHEEFVIIMVEDQVIYRGMATVCE